MQLICSKQLPQLVRAYLRGTGAPSWDLLGPDGPHGLAFMVGPACSVRFVWVTREPYTLFRTWHMRSYRQELQTRKWRIAKMYMIYMHTRRKMYYSSSEDSSVLVSGSTSASHSTGNHTINKVQKKMAPYGVARTLTVKDTGLSVLEWS